MSQEALRSEIIDCLQSDPQHVVCMPEDGTKFHKFLCPGCELGDTNLMALLRMGLHAVCLNKVPNTAPAMILLFPKAA